MGQSRKLRKWTCHQHINQVNGPSSSRASGIERGICISIETRDQSQSSDCFNNLLYKSETLIPDDSYSCNFSFEILRRPYSVFSTGKIYYCLHLFRKLSESY